MDSTMSVSTMQKAVEGAEASPLPPTNTEESTTEAVDLKITDMTKQPDMGHKTSESQLPQPTQQPSVVKKASVHKKGSSSSSSHHLKFGYLSTMQKQRVDSAFLTMFGYPWGTMPIVAVSQASSQCRNCRRYVLLKKIFGPRSAAQILHNISTSSSSPTTTTTTTRENNNQPGSNNNGAINQTKLVLVVAPTSDTGTAATPRIQKKMHEVTTSTTAQNDILPNTNSATATDAPTNFVSTEKQDSNVPQLEAKSSVVHGDGGVAAGGGGGGGGVDALLQRIHGPKGTSTIMKTAMDWESFKEESGVLGEKLEQHAESKGAYLKRQDFLTRVDQRKFEQERQERERNRTRKS